jgi:hypothetical protein
MFSKPTGTLTKKIHAQPRESTSAAADERPHGDPDAHAQGSCVVSTRSRRSC